MTATTAEDPITKEISKRYYQEYDSLTDAQKLKSGTKEEHDARRTEYGLTGTNSKVDTKPRMAGEALRKLKRADERNQTGIDNAKEAVYGGGIEKFDPAAAGKGSGRGAARLSRMDIKGLHESGASKQEILDYAAANPDVKRGAKAQKLLDKYTADLAQPEEEPIEVAPDNPPNPDVPEDGTLPVEPAPTPEPTPAPEPDYKIEGGETPSTYDANHWYSDANTDQLLKNLGRYKEESREANNYHFGQLSDRIGQITNQYMGNDNSISDALGFVGGMIQDAKDRSLIYQTRAFGDLDNFVRPNMPTERHDDSVPDPDLEGITEDAMDRIEDM